MRNNEDRLGAPRPSEPPPLNNIQESPTNPEAQPQALQFVTPTEFVELPTKGRFYPEGHPLHNVDVVEIKHMTAKDEDILTSKALLKKGLAIDRFLQNIIVDKRIRVEDLYVGDKNAIIVSSRINGYGREYSTRVTCPVCSSADEFTFDLGTAKVKTPDEAECKHLSEDKFLVKLPKMNVDVIIRLLTGKDEKKLLQINERAKKQKMPEANLTTQLMMFIVSVNDVSDPLVIRNLVQNMPASDSRFLRDAYKNLCPDIDLTQWYSCDVCGNEEEMEVPFTTDFFWPKR